jgi:hypothetical protein
MEKEKGVMWASGSMERASLCDGSHFNPTLLRGNRLLSRFAWIS